MSECVSTDSNVCRLKTVRNQDPREEDQGTNVCREMSCETRLLKCSEYTQPVQCTWQSTIESEVFVKIVII